MLGNLRQVDALLVVLDGFSGTRVPADDLETLNLELLVADRDHVERRLERVTKQAKSGDLQLRKEVEELGRVLAHVDAGGTLADWPRRAAGPSLEPLTTKPLLAVENGPNGIDLKLEAELAEMSEVEAADFRGRRFGSERGRAPPQRTSWDSISFFTAGEQGDPCVVAATGTRRRLERRGDDSHGHRAWLHPGRGDPLGRPRRKPARTRRPPAVDCSASKERPTSLRTATC